jgi:DNA-binding response OmpR family regulator
LKIYNLLNKKDVNNVVWRHKMSEMKILVVDDESRMRKLLKDFLTGKGYIVLEAEDGQQALDVFFANEDIKLVLLDVMMPKLDGWGVLKEIRQYSETPVIMLTAKADEQDELNGFNLGVDEYIAKPFSLKILSARIDAVLRRTTVSDEADLEADGIKINKLAHQVTVDGQIVELSVKEFELLSYFMLNRGIALSRNKILNSVWQYEYDGGARTIDTHVKKLRSKLGEKGKYITTIWGYGYKFECN